MATKIPLFNIKPSPEVIEDAVEDYFENLPPGSGDEPLLAAHVADPTPHPIYDSLASGRFVTHLQNGMA